MNREIKFRAWDKTGFHKGMVYDPKLNVVLEDNSYEVMQFTGLKDKNGKEIYEGDIIDWKGDKWIVEYSGSCFVVVFGNCENTVDSVNDNCEVIGNKFENPELLDAKGDKSE